jgi:heptosyltransferase-1
MDYSVKLPCMSQFLIVKTSAIGDVIQSLHVVGYLKTLFPDCSVDWVVEKGIAPLLKAHPQIDTVLEIDTKTWRKSPLKQRREISNFAKLLRMKTYDALFDLQSNVKSGLICALAKAHKKVGYDWNSVKEKPNFLATNVHFPNKEINVRRKYSSLLENFFGVLEDSQPQDFRFKLTHDEEKQLAHLDLLESPRLMVCFGSNWENKKLSLETLKAFLQLIDQAYFPCYLFIYGNEGERKIAEGLESEFQGRGKALGKMSLPLWQNTIFLVDAMITMDSASLHLCGTTLTPSFSLFGPSRADAFKPIGSNHFAFQGSCPYGQTFTNRCKNLRTCKTGACLKEVKAEQLFAQFQEFWTTVSGRSLACQRKSPHES